METAAVNLAALGVDPDGDAGGDPRPGALRQARPRPLPRRRRAARVADRDRGGGRRRDLGHARCACAAARSASACSAAATARTSCARPAPSGSSTIPPTSCCTSTRSAGGASGAQGGRVTVAPSVSSAKSLTSTRTVRSQVAGVRQRKGAGAPAVAVADRLDAEGLEAARRIGEGDGDLQRIERRAVRVGDRERHHVRAGPAGRQGGVGHRRSAVHMRVDFERGQVEGARRRGQPEAARERQDRERQDELGRDRAPRGSPRPRASRAIAGVSRKRLRAASARSGTTRASLAASSRP